MTDENDQNCEYFEDCDGVDVDDIIKVEDIRNNRQHAITKLINGLQQRGWIVVDIAGIRNKDEDENKDENENKNCTNPEKSRRKINTSSSEENDFKSNSLFLPWRETFLEAFNQEENVKENGGLFRMEKGLSLGYKKDDTREFFETRLLFKNHEIEKIGEIEEEEGSKVEKEAEKYERKKVNEDGDKRIRKEIEREVSEKDINANQADLGSIIPDYPLIQNYSETVRALFSALSELSILIISKITESMGLDPCCILDLTDLKIITEMEKNQNFVTENNKGSSLSDDLPSMISNTIGYSSSLLRICRYSREMEHDSITDTNR